MKSYMPKGTQLGSYLSTEQGRLSQPSNLTSSPYLRSASGVAGYPGNHLAGQCSRDVGVRV